MRDDKERLQLMNGQPLSMQDGLMMQGKNSNVVKYMECSSLSNYGVNEVFEEAARAALKFVNRTNERKCCLL